MIVYYFINRIISNYYESNKKDTTTESKTASVYQKVQNSTNQETGEPKPITTERVNDKPKETNWNFLDSVCSLIVSSFFYSKQKQASVEEQSLDSYETQIGDRVPLNPENTPSKERIYHEILKNPKEALSELQPDQIQEGTVQALYNDAIQTVYKEAKNSNTINDPQFQRLILESVAKLNFNQFPDNKTISMVKNILLNLDDEVGKNPPLESMKIIVSKCPELLKDYLIRHKLNSFQSNNTPEPVLPMIDKTTNEPSLSGKETIKSRVPLNEQKNLSEETIAQKINNNREQALSELQPNQIQQGRVQSFYNDAIQVVYRQNVFSKTQNDPKVQKLILESVMKLDFGVFPDRKTLSIVKTILQNLNVELQNDLILEKMKRLFVHYPEILEELDKIKTIQPKLDKTSPL